MGSALRGTTVIGPPYSGDARLQGAHFTMGRDSVPYQRDRQVVGSIPLEGSEAIQDCVAGPEHACDMTQECWSRPYP